MDQQKNHPTPAESTAGKQRGRPFRAGASGNPAGRPSGTRNRATIMAEALLEGEAETLTRRAIDLAKQGEMPALRFCLERLLPVRQRRAVTFDLPRIETAAEGVDASSAVLAACAEGRLSPGEATEIMGLIATHVRALEAADGERVSERSGKPPRG
jgi:hypothetical protein